MSNNKMKTEYSMFCVKCRKMQSVAAVPKQISWSSKVSGTACSRKGIEGICPTCGIRMQKFVATS